MMLQPASYPRHRFPAEVISHAVWLYHVFSLRLRDVVVTHESIRHWCLQFGADFASRLRRRRLADTLREAEGVLEAGRHKAGETTMDLGAMVAVMFTPRPILLNKSRLPNRG